MPPLEADVTQTPDNEGQHGKWLAHYPGEADPELWTERVPKR